MANTTEHLHRRTLLQGGLTAALGALPLLARSNTGTKPVIEVWKTPTCGCCHDWIKHLQSNGYEVKTHDVSDATKRDYRQRLGLADKFGSCHTALVGGYLLEGHVPARDIQRLLKEKPKAVGLAAPGMPQGSPGMETATPVPYETLLVQADGSTTVFAKH